MWQIQWLRRFIRRNTRKIPVERAMDQKKRYSLLYLFASWNAFAAVLYMCSTGRANWMKAGGYETEDLPPGKSWAKALGIKKAHVFQVSGFRVVGEYDIDEEKNTVEQNDEKITVEENDEEIAEYKETFVQDNETIFS